MDPDPTRKHCSFCGITGSHEPPLVGGLGAFICGDCVDGAAAAVARRRAEGEDGPVPWAESTTTDLLSKLWLIAQTGYQAEAFLAEWVGMVRSRGASWAEIGQALGISRRAAEHRFALEA